MAALQNGVPSTVVCGQVGAARLRWKLFFCVVYINCFMLLEVKGQYYTGDHPWAVKDHSEDVFHSSGDIDTQPKVFFFESVVASWASFGEQVCRRRSCQDQAWVS